MNTSTSTDHALRTISPESDFRILVISAGDTVAEILDAQNPHESSRGMFADLITASILLRLTMSPDYRLQAILQTPDAGRMVGDSHPDGITRGLVQRFGDAPFATGASTQLSVHRTLYGGETHEGVVRTGENQRLADAVTGYLHRSEQITSVIDIDHTFDGDDLTFAGGYLVQLVPQGERPDQSDLALMTARLENLPSVPRLFDRCDDDTADVADTLYGPIEFEALEANEFDAGCVCSVERVRKALVTLPDEDLDDLEADGDVVEVDCDYCGQSHEVELAELRS